MKNKFQSMVAKAPQNTGGGSSQCSVLQYKSALLIPTVNRRSTDGQSKRHCKQTPLSKRWKVLMTLVFLFTMGIGQMWGADPTSTYDVSDLISAGTITTSTTNDDLDQTIDNVVYDWNKGGSSNNVKISSQRVQLFGDGQSLTISTSSDYRIKSIRFAVGNKSNSPTAIVESSSAGSWSPAFTTSAFNTGNYTFTVTTPTAGGSYTFTIYKSGGTNQRADFDDIVVTYDAAPVANPTVVYYPNGATSGTVPVDANSPYASGDDVTVLGNSGNLDKTAMEFVGWNTKADGSGTSYQAGNVISDVTTNIKLYAQWAYPATGTGTITYTLTKGKADVSAEVSGVSTLSSSSTAFSVSTLAIGSDNKKDGYSGQITGHAEDYSASQYVALQFTVADGYTFTPSAVSMKVFANSTSNMKMKLVFTDGVTSVESEELACSSSADSDIEFASGKFTGKKFVGNVDVVLYQWGVTSKRTYVKSPVTITGTVATATNYTITYDANGGSGTMSNSTNIVSECTFTAPDETKEFKEWRTNADGTGTKYEAGEDATSDLNLFAIWQTHTASNNANLSALEVAGCALNETFDPATTAYTISLPFYGVMPAASAVTATKADPHASDPVVSVEGNVITVEVTPESGAAGKKTYTITVNIAEAPTASSSINIEQWVLSNGAGKGNAKVAEQTATFLTALTAANIAYTNANELDSLTTAADRNEPYLGLKFKSSSSTITIIVPADQTLKVKFGARKTTVKVAINDGAAGDASITDGVYSLAATSAIRQVKFSVTENNKTIVLKQVMIGENIKSVQLPWKVTYDAGEHGTCATASAIWKGTALTLPEVTPESGWDFEGWYDGETKITTSTYTPTADVTLVAHYTAQAAGTDLQTLTYQIGAGAATAVGYTAGYYTYNIELPYKPSYDAITVNVTPVSGASIKAGASMTVSSLPGAATFTVTDGVSEQAYTVNFKKAAKDGICIIKATPTSATEATADGLYKGNAYFNGRANDKKLNNNGEHYVGVALASGYTFQSGDEVRLNQVAEVNGTTDLSKIYLYKEVPTGDNLIVTLDNTGVQGDNVFAMPSEFYGESALYIGRKDANCNPTVGYLAVYRAMNPVLKKMTVAGVDGTPNNLNAITIEVPYSTPATALASIAYDWVSNSDAWTADPANAPVVANEWAFGEANTVTLEDKDGDQTSYTVTINKAAASAVNTLSYLEVDGVEVDVPGNGIYTIADPLPYGTQPIITNATATHAGAVAEISYTPVHYVDANNDFWYVQVVVTPEDQDPAHRGYYQVRYTNLPKMGVTLIKGALTSNTAATITGLVGGTYDLNIGSEVEDGGYKVISGNYFGLTLADGYFQNGDIIAIEVTKASTSGGSTMAVYSDNSASAEKLITNSGALGKVGMNYFVLSIPTNVDNLNTLYIARNDENNPDNKWNGYVKSFEVMRVMPSVIKSFVVEGAQGEIDQVNKTIAVEVPKSSSLAALTPVVEAYANGGATVTPTGAQNFADGAVTYTVNSAYPTEDAAVEYQVTITKSISDKIVIFDGTENNAAVHESPDATGLAWTLTGSISVESKSAPATASKAYAKALQSGSTSSSKNIKVTVPENYQARFFVAHNSNGSARTLYIDTEYGQSPKDGIYNVSNTSADIAEGYSATVGEGDYYVNIAGGTVNIYELAVILTPVSPKPTITTQPVSKTDFGAGNLTATVAATVTEGTLSYQWYNADGNVAVDGATGTTLTTTTEGTYYVIVTNTKAGLPSNSVKSNEAELAYRDLTIATLSALGYGDPATAITLEENKYAYNVYLPEGTTDVPALSATATQAAYGVTPVIADAAAFIDYKATSTVTVTAEDHQTQLTYTVKFHVAHSIDALVDVTENTIWDWTEITARADGSEIDVPSGDKVYGPQVVTADGLILANYVLGGNKWDRIEGNNGGYAIRSSSNKFYQGASLHFRTTRDGFVTIKARNDGSSMTLNVENAGRDLELGTLPKNSFEDFVVYVKAGDVTIYNVPANPGKPMRVQRIEFAVKESADYTRAEMLGNGVYGTICLPNNVPAGAAFGVTFYELMGRENTYGKLVFDEITNGALEAGKPYVFQAHGDALEIFYGATHVDNPVDAGNGMYGTFEQTVLSGDQLDGVYYFAQKALWSCDGAIDLTIPANRAYVKLSEIDYLPANDQPAPGRRRVTMAVNGEKVATGMGEIEASETPMKVMIDGQLFIIRGEKMFDATGRLVK